MHSPIDDRKWLVAVLHRSGSVPMKATDEVSRLPLAAKRFVSGGFSGTLSAAILQPFDVIKTTQQGFRICNLDTGRPVPGMIPMARFIVSNEGVRALWKGLSATVIRVYFGAGIYFASLHTTSDYLKQRQSEQKQIPMQQVRLSSTTSFLVGFFARTFSVMAMSPVSVVKTRLEWDGKTSTQIASSSSLPKAKDMISERRYNGTFHALQTILRSEGVASLYSGLLPTILRDAPYSGTYYLFYSNLKRWFENREEFHEKYPFLTTFCSGMVAGAMATIVTHPPDVLKTRLQLKSANGTFVDGRILLHELLHVIRVDGFLSLFTTGVNARIVKRTISTAMTWTLFEEFMQRAKKSST